MFHFVHIIYNSLFIGVFSRYDGKNYTKRTFYYGKNLTNYCFFVTLIEISQQKECIMTHNNKQAVLQRFKQFVSFRNKFGLALAIVILVCYYGFIVGVGFFPEVLGYRLGPSAITLGIILGIFLIVLSIALTGVYTLFANKYFDKEQEEVIQELDKNGLIEDLKEGR